ncbi:MAG: rod-binding protein, partial [Paracoccaceae bacterium]
IFLENLQKQARESKLSDGLFDTNADDNFVEMFDKELANTSSKLVDIGIAEAIIRQMSSKISDVNS